VKDQQEQMAACCRVRGSGTGFLIAPDRVAMCNHTVEDLAIGDLVELGFYGGTGKIKGTLVARDPEGDAAVIAVPRIDGLRPFRLVEEYAGRDAWEGYGFPDGAGRNLIPLSGTVDAPSAQYGESKEVMLLDCTKADGASVIGWSGSPVLVDGVVVGMVRGYCPDKHDRTMPAYRLLIAAPTRVIRALAPDLPVPLGPVADYVAKLEDDTSWIKLQGISSGAGESLEATGRPIESIYTPLRAREPRRAAEGLAHEELRTEETRLSDLLPRVRHLLFVGDPGSGKTTFLHLVACMLARDVLGKSPPEGRSFRSLHLGFPDDAPAPLPIFVRLAELASALELRTERDLLPGVLLHAVAPDTDLANRRTEREAMARALGEGRAMLLLDGLDEVSRERSRERVFALIAAARRAWPEAAMVATSRPFDTKRLTGPGFDFQEVWVEPFGPEQIGEFLRRWVAALPGEQRGYRAELEAAIVQRDDIRKLAENPVMLTCLCVIHWNERKLPHGRAAAYRAVIKWLLQAREEKRKSARYAQAFAEAAIAELALQMMVHPSGKCVEVALADAARMVEPVVRTYRKKVADSEDPRHAAGEWLRWETTGSGLLRLSEQGKIRFWHLTFQEFLGAERLTSWEADEEGAKAWWPVLRPKLYDPQWAVALDLFPACLLLNKHGIEKVSLLLDRIAATRVPGPVGLWERLLPFLRPKATLRGDARLLVLLDRLLNQLEVYDYPVPDGIQAIHDELALGARRIFEAPGSSELAWDERLPVAEVLGRLGDFRLATSPLDRMLPVKGRDLALGKYPVTVEEYRAFVDAGGYKEEGFWDAEGWRIRVDHGWESPGSWDQQVDHRNWPVTGVSWFEAMAFCAWLSAKTGKAIQLPTEDEWQAAATHPEGLYPWGKEEPSPELANYGFNVGHPTPVGLYPLGKAPGGHLDMAGNVWEWCSDKLLRDGSAAAQSDPLAGAPFRGLRGGSYWHDAGNLRSADRDSCHAGDRGDFFGFRLALSPACLVR
jgi:DNA polymerase III delta prime subunit